MEWRTNGANLATEMLEALGVDTSKTFSLFETGERLQRHDEPSPTRASILVRLRHSHLRFGNFQRHAFLGEPGRIQRLLDFSIEHYEDDLLLEACYAFLHESQVGYDQFFFDGYGGHASSARAAASPAAGKYLGPLWEAFARLLGGYGPAREHALSHPYFGGSRPCSMLIEEVESIWSDIAARDDHAALEAKIASISALGGALGHTPAR